MMSFRYCDNITHYGVDDGERDPSFWKFNCTLVNDRNYRDLLDENVKNWLEEFKELWISGSFGYCSENIKFDS